MYARLFILNFILLFGFTLRLLAQDSLINSGTSYKTLIHILQTDPSDLNRSLANDEYKRRLVEILNRTDDDKSDLDSLTNLSQLKSPDEKFIIYTWVIASVDIHRYQYFGFLHFKTSESKFQVLELQDSTSEIKKPEAEKLRPERWFGAVYYSIIPVKKSGQVYYTLLGWKGKNKLETMKVIEILYFDKNKVRFGYPLIKTDDVFRSRLIFNFTSQASMVLRYEAKKKMIVFDHLTGQNQKNKEPLPMTESGPDGSYDALKLKSGRWIYQKDVDIRSNWKPSGNVPAPQVK